MNAEDIIKLGTSLGLEFNRSSNYKDALAKGRVVFDGCNGQRFLFEADWLEPIIYKTMGEALINKGKRMKCLELNRVLSINTD